MEKLITGYQYGDDFRFTGPYKFPNNEDQEAVHLPPHTTLKAPPEVTNTGEAAFFDVAADSWIVRTFEDPIARLQAEHAAAMKKAEDERLAALEQSATEMQPPEKEASNVSAS